MTQNTSKYVNTSRRCTCTVCTMTDAERAEAQAKYEAACDDGRWTISSSRNAIPGRTKEVFWTFATKDEAVGFAMARARQF